MVLFLNIPLPDQRFLGGSGFGFCFANLFILFIFLFVFMMSTMLSERIRLCDDDLLPWLGLGLGMI